MTSLNNVFSYYCNIQFKSMFSNQFNSKSFLFYRSFLIFCLKGMIGKGMIWRGDKGGKMNEYFIYTVLLDIICWNWYLHLSKAPF